MHSLLGAARAGFRSAQATVSSAQEALRVNEAQYKRMQELRTRGLVAQKDLDDAANNFASARGTRDSDVAALSKAEGLLGGLPSTPDEQLAGYKMAQVALAQAKLDLEHATVRAPMDGTIGKTNLQPGDFLGVGQAAMPLVATAHLWVDANYKETELTNVIVNQPATVEVDTYPGKKWKAHVSSISSGLGRGVFRAAAAKRDGQLGEDRAAHSGASVDRRSERRRSASAARGHECERRHRHRRAELDHRPSAMRMTTANLRASPKR